MHGTYSYSRIWGTFHICQTLCIRCTLQIQTCFEEANSESTCTQELDSHVIVDLKQSTPDCLRLYLGTLPGQTQYVYKPLQNWIIWWWRCYQHIQNQRNRAASIVQLSRWSSGWVVPKTMIHLIKLRCYIANTICLSLTQCAPICTERI